MKFQSNINIYTRITKNSYTAVCAVTLSKWKHKYASLCQQMRSFDLSSRLEEMEMLLTEGSLMVPGWHHRELWTSVTSAAAGQKKERSEPDVHDRHSFTSCWTWGLRLLQNNNTEFTCEHVYTPWHGIPVAEAHSERSATLTIMTHLPHSFKWRHTIKHDQDVGQHLANHLSLWKVHTNGMLEKFHLKQI